MQHTIRQFLINEMIQMLVRMSQMESQLEQTSMLDPIIGKSYRHVNTTRATASIRLAIDSA